MSDGMKAHYEPIYPHVRFESLVHSFSEPVPQFSGAAPRQDVASGIHGAPERIKC